MLAGLGPTGGLLADEPVAAIAGFGLLGIGLGPVVPLAFSAAGSLDAEHRGRMISRVAAIGYIDSVSGPLAIGGLAEAVGLPSALVVPALLSVVVALENSMRLQSVSSPTRTRLRCSARPPRSSH